MDAGGFYFLHVFFTSLFFCDLFVIEILQNLSGLIPGSIIRQVLILLVILVLTFPLSGALAELTKMIPIPHSWEIYFKAKEAARVHRKKHLSISILFHNILFRLIIIGLLPAIFEEVCFRGGLQNILMRWFKGPWIAIIITSIIFSAVHISYYGFLVRAVLGVVLGLIFYYSGSLWLSILFHFLYNGLQVTALYFTTTSVSCLKKFKRH